jgi:ADP-ribose pyrophosphatase YjhB (NUDIX family)
MQLIGSAGGVIIKDNHVLLVQVTYGANKGYWMLPGGLVEEGETFEQAAIREVKEETGIVANTIRLIAVRTGVKENSSGLEYGIYLIYEMEEVAGSPIADGLEVSAAQYRRIDEVLQDPMVVGLSQEIICSVINTAPGNGLFRVEKPILTNNSYLHYDVHTLGGKQ